MLVASIAGSMSAGVLIPAVGLLVEPYLLVWLGALLFLNLIRIRMSDLAATFTRPTHLAALTIVKLFVLPLTMYGFAYVIDEPFALPVLLLSGISTGLGAPFVANLIGGRLSIVVGMIISTSIAVPFVLPSIVYALVGSQFSIPISQMIFLLSIALFTPLALGWITKRYLPAISRFADEKSFNLSLMFIVLINFGMFARFSDYFYSNQTFMLYTVVTAFLCYATFSFVGYAVASIVIRSNKDIDRYQRTAGLISMSYINNVLVAVFALQFFGPAVAALAALYNIPYYSGIMVLKKIMSKV